MLQEQADVSSEKKIIGKATYPQFETVDEALNNETYGLGEEKLLDILNSQIKTNAMNTLRTSLTKGPSKSSLRSEAVNQIVQELTAGEHQNVIGDKEALDALISRRVTQLEQEVKEAVVSNDDEDDEDEE